jgi:hypothetical protein
MPNNLSKRKGNSTNIEKRKGKFKGQSRRVNESRGNSRGYRKSSRPPREPANNPTGIPGMYAVYQQLSDRSQNDEVVLFNNINTKYDANIADISANWVEPAILRAAEAKVVDRFSAAEIADYADYICYAAQLLTEMRSLKMLIDVSKSITRSDSTAGAPWTRASYNTYVASITGTEPVHIPYMSMNLAGLHTTPMVISNAIPFKGYSNLYFYPMLPSKKPSDIESLLNTMSTKFAGLISSNQYHQLGRYATVADLQYRAPVLEMSSIGKIFQYYTPAADNTHINGEKFDASYALNTDMRIPVDVNYDYHRVLSVGATTDAWEFPTPGANSLSLQHAAIDAANLTVVADFATTPAAYRTYASYFDKFNTMTSSSGEEIVYRPMQQTVSIGIDESGHNRLLQNVLTRDISREIFPTAGLITLGIVPLGARIEAARQQGIDSKVAQQVATQTGSLASQNNNQGGNKTGSGNYGYGR